MLIFSNMYFCLDLRTVHFLSTQYHARIINPQWTREKNSCPNSSSTVII